MTADADSDSKGSRVQRAPSAGPGSTRGERQPESRPDSEDVLAWPRLPAAATPARRLGPLYVLTLLSAIDGSLLALAAGGQLESVGGAIAVGLTVVAGAGSWLAAQHAFAGRPGTRDLVSLSLLGVVTVAATLLSAVLGTALGAAVALHVLPKVAGLVLFLVAAEVAGLRLPAAGRLPLPALGLAVGVVLEVAVRWIP